jgi:hypothetical protein
MFFFLIVAKKRCLNQASSKNVSEGNHFNSCFFTANSHWIPLLIDTEDV